MQDFWTTAKPVCLICLPFFFFFNDTAPPEISPLPLHAALPISWPSRRKRPSFSFPPVSSAGVPSRTRSEEHTSELQSPCNLVCRLLLEKKKKKTTSAMGRTDLLTDA